MKYVKTYEELTTNLKDTSSLTILLYNFLSNILPDNKIDKIYRRIGHKPFAEILKIKTYDARKNLQYRDFLDAFSIECSNLKDKKMKTDENKLKISLLIDDYNIRVSDNSEIIINLIIFLKEVFEKYSYLYKKSGKSEYFIKTNDINNIMNDLKEFETWINAKKYNI